jgi:hypothetical protein
MGSPLSVVVMISWEVEGLSNGRSGTWQASGMAADNGFSAQFLSGMSQSSKLPEPPATRS